jgi:hypothetical protein
MSDPGPGTTPAPGPGPETSGHAPTPRDDEATIFYVGSGSDEDDGDDDEVTSLYATRSILASPVVRAKSAASQLYGSVVGAAVRTVSPLLDGEQPVVDALAPLHGGSEPTQPKQVFKSSSRRLIRMSSQQDRWAQHLASVAEHAELVHNQERERAVNGGITKEQLRILQRGGEEADALAAELNLEEARWETDPCCSKPRYWYC